MQCKLMEKIGKKDRTKESLLAVLLLIVAVIFFIFGVVKSRQSRIASVDMDKVVGAHPVMQELVVNFQKEISGIQEQFDKMKEEEKIKNQQKIQQEISEMALRLQKEALDKVAQDIKRIAKSKGYNYVLDKNAVIVGGKDITDEILAVISPKQAEEATSKGIDASEMPMIPVE